MAALPYMQLYIADYLADTMHLSTEEHGAYLLLMFNYWQTGRPIPKARLAKIARMSNDRWISVECSLKEFFNDNGTEWTHDRIDRDLEIVRKAIEQKSAAGKASAAKRKIANSTKSEREANDRSTPVEQTPNDRSTPVENPLEQNGNGEATNKDKYKDKYKDKDLKPPLNPPKGKKVSEKFDPLSVELPGWLSAELWAEWVGFRKELKKPIKTLRGVTASIKSLDEYRAQGHSPESVINHCIANEYQGLYAPQKAAQLKRDINQLSGIDTQIPAGFRGAK